MANPSHPLTLEDAQGSGPALPCPKCARPAERFEILDLRSQSSILPAFDFACAPCVRETARGDTSALAALRALLNPQTPSA